MKCKYYKYTKEYCDYLNFLHTSYRTVKDYIFYYHLVKRKIPLTQNTDIASIAGKIRNIAAPFAFLFCEEICDLPDYEGYGFIDEFCNQIMELRK